MLFEKVGPYTPRQAEWSPHQLESLLISRWGENLGVEHLVQYLVVAQHHFGEISSDTISWLQQTTHFPAEIPAFAKLKGNWMQ